jgi:hypothetical protein
MTMPLGSQPSIYFSDVFGVAPETLAEYGAFDVSLISDLPLFIDPFLLFNSEKPEYRALHDEIIRYLVFLKDRAASGSIRKGLLESWFTFREVKETWLGYSREGNQGHGLGSDFARALHANLGRLFASFGTESVTNGSHLEKLCLVADGVGKDSISDFATNLIKPYLLEFTQGFAQRHLRPDQRKVYNVEKARFNYATETWASRRFELPYTGGSYVILTPVDMLTKDDVWINKADMIRDYDEIVASVSNEQLRDQLSRYFMITLESIMARDDAKRREKSEATLRRQRTRRERERERERREPTQRQTGEAAVATIKQHPEVIDYYIRYKEDRGDEAEAQADERVRSSERLFIGQIRTLAQFLESHTEFYRHPGDTIEGARLRLAELELAIEERGAAELLYFEGEPVERDSDFHIVMRNVWCNVPRPRDGAPSNSTTPRQGCYSKKVVRIKAGSHARIVTFLDDAASESEAAIARAVICFGRADYSQIRAYAEALELDEDRGLYIINASL